jgi:protocatechuate 3,4-dioxygenase beta subunit
VGRAPRPCAWTEPNIEGPYYRPGAPKTAELRPARADGTPLIVTGRVLSADCRTVLAGATLDVWQADAAGHYDNDGTMSPEILRFRGLVDTDASGSFRVSTIVPGRYLNGRTYRPAHIHVKLSAAGHRPLTTQLYFPDDPFNDHDPFRRPSLIMDVEGDDSCKRAVFDFVLQPLA